MRIATKLLIGSIIAEGMAITLPSYIYTNVDAIFLTQEEVVSSTIVTLAGKVGRAIKTATMTIAHVCFGNAPRPIQASEFFGGA